MSWIGVCASAVVPVLLSARRIMSDSLIFLTKVFVQSSRRQIADRASSAWTFARQFKVIFEILAPRLGAGRMTPLAKNGDP
jgi:hypothetical protein